MLGAGRFGQKNPSTLIDPCIITVRVEKKGTTTFKPIEFCKVRSSGASQSTRSDGSGTAPTAVVEPVDAVLKSGQLLVQFFVTNKYGVVAPPNQVKPLAANAAVMRLELGTRAGFEDALKQAEPSKTTS